MTDNCIKTRSVWTDTFKAANFDSLKENQKCDICIIGAGISGITSAYLLAKEGKNVILLDDGKIGGGETGNTTAHITSVIDDRFCEIEKIHGNEIARTAAQSQRVAIDEIERIVKFENIHCDFKRLNGYLLFEPSDLLFMEEYEAAMRAGMDVEISSSPIHSFKSYNVLMFPRQGQFHVLKYISALANSIVKTGGKIFTNTFINEIEDSKDGVLIKSRDGHKINAEDAVIATNSPISDCISIHTRQAAFRTYVLGFKIEKNSLPAALFWDTETPYHYIRIYSGKQNDILIIGGEDHKTGGEENPESRFRRLEDWSNCYFKNIGKPVYSWSGQIMEPIDGLGFIGKDPENSEHVYIITGDSGMGMTNATFGGMIIRDLITGKTNNWAEVYDPKRIAIKTARDFVKEGASTVSHYFEYITPGDIKNIDEIKKGEGAVLRDGLEKIAVYKDNKGKVTKFSAVCTHLKCILHWNSVEKSWDCPCHGSRFDCNGKVLNGPAISDMKKIEDKVLPQAI